MNIRALLVKHIIAPLLKSQSLTLQSPELINFFGGGPTASGKSVSPDGAMALSAMWGCARILSETIGSVPWGIYRRDPKTRNAERASEHQLDTVLTYKPNRNMTSVEFREAMVLNLVQAGNAYAWREDFAGKPVSLDPLRASHVKPKVKGQQGVSTKLAIPDGEVFYSILDRGQWSDYPREKVWHVKGFGNDGMVGLSPIGVVREAFGAALAAEEFGAKFFAQGGKPSGVISIPNWLSDDQRAIARENLTQMLGGNANAHKFALFEGGMKPEPWGELSLQDMQFIMLRRFNVHEIARIYRIPPHMLADLEKGASYASVEMMSSEFVQFTLLPYFTRFEAAAQRWLLGPKEQDHFLRFNFEGLLRADSKGRAEFYQSGLQNGWMNRNEVRALENLPRQPGLDDFTVQINLAPVDMLRDVVERSGKQPTDPAPGKALMDRMERMESNVLTVFASKPEQKAQPILVQVGAPQITMPAPSVVVGGAKVTVPPVDLSQLKAPVVTVEGHNVKFPDTIKVESPQTPAALLASLGVGAETLKAVEAMHKDISKPRRIVTDDEGNPIGTEMTETL